MNPLDFLVNDMMMPILGFFHSLTNSWGMAIIFLTLVIRGLIFPLSMKQYVSMKAMQELQPRLKELQAKYKDNRAKQQEETLKLFKQHKVNPVGGCLPLFVQIPIFFGLFRMLQSASELIKEVAKLKVGEAAELRVSRSGQEKTFKVPLGKMPSQPEGEK